MYEKCKDKDPYDTILTAKQFLLKAKILVTEKWNDIDIELYSVHLRIDGTRFFVNGKGTTKVFALASAYGELMERLQNLTFFSISTNILKMDINDYNDGTKIKTIEKSEIHKKLYKWLVVNKCKNIDIFIDLWIKYWNKYDFNIRYYIFNECNGNDYFELPRDVVDLYYGTNGMAAGNTSDEACVQALSEILERYVNKKVVMEDITPPNIDENLLNNFPNILKYKENIEKTGIYKIELKDLSLGYKIPAIGLILYNTDNMKYFVKIAVHPNIGIALERCFTELMQGKSIINYSGMVSASETRVNAVDSQNLYNIFINGSGKYPYLFFTGTPSYDSHLVQKSFISNSDMKDYLLDIINSMGYKTYFYNATKSDFYAIHLIVPGLSEIININETKYINNIINECNIRQLINNNINKLTQDEAVQIINYLDSMNYRNDLKLSTILGLDFITTENPFELLTVSIFKCMLYLIIKDYNNAYLCIHDFNKGLDLKNKNSKYYLCFELLLLLKKDYMDLNYISLFLEKYFDKHLVQKVLLDCNKYPFISFSDIICEDNCSKCKLMSKCYRRNEKEIYLRIRKYSKDKHISI